jgi:uncharacterized protein YggE
MGEGGDMRSIKIALSVLMLTLPVQVSAAENIRKITVTGKSEITLDADHAIIQLEIKHIKKEMSQSHRALTETIAKLTKALMSIGVTDKDIRKSLILQGPEYSWEKNSRVHKGYYSECIVELDVNDISKMAAIYRELANYQNITIQGTDYKRNDEFDVREKEFEKALLAAKKKAEHMAQALNVRIGKVYAIQELSLDNLVLGHTYANVEAKKERMLGEDRTGYGNIRISALVVVEFELE